MRVTALAFRVAFLVLPVPLALLAASAEAQSNVAPATDLVFDAHVSYLSVGGLGEHSLEGAGYGASVRASWALTDDFELGAGAGLRGSSLSLQGIGSRTRVGLVPVRVWVGTGAGTPEEAFGIRVFVGVDASLFGLEDLSSNGEFASIEFESSFLRTWSLASLVWRVGVGAAYAGEFAVSGVIRSNFTLELGEVDWSVRPVLGGQVAFATDIGHRQEFRAGLSWRTSSFGWLLGVGVRPFADPAGELVRLWLEWQLNPRAQE